MRFSVYFTTIHFTEKVVLEPIIRIIINSHWSKHFVHMFIASMLLFGVGRHDVHSNIGTRSAKTGSHKSLSWVFSDYFRSRLYNNFEGCNLTEESTFSLNVAGNSTIVILALSIHFLPLPLENQPTTMDKEVKQLCE